MSQFAFDRSKRHGWGQGRWQGDTHDKIVNHTPTYDKTVAAGVTDKYNHRNKKQESGYTGDHPLLCEYNGPFPPVDRIPPQKRLAVLPQPSELLKVNYQYKSNVPSTARIGKQMSGALLNAGEEAFWMDMNRQDRPDERLVTESGSNYQFRGFWDMKK
jgi:hypothetical protein